MRVPRRLFLISVEGQKTERQYFVVLEKMLGREHNFHIEFAGAQSCSKSSPKDVLARLKRDTVDEKPDEAWLVVDKDERKESAFVPLHNWVKTGGRGYEKGLAISAPKFESWLLLHFEETTVCDSSDCTRKLKGHVPRYNKDVDPGTYTKEMVSKAARRAYKTHGGKSSGSCYTTVDVLVKHILAT